MQNDSHQASAGMGQFVWTCGSSGLVSMSGPGVTRGVLHAPRLLIVYVTAGGLVLKGQSVQEGATETRGLFRTTTIPALA